MTATRTKRIATRLFRSLLAAVLALLVGKQAYRVSLFGAAAFSPRRMRSLHHFGESGLVPR